MWIPPIELLLKKRVGLVKFTKQRSQIKEGSNKKTQIKEEPNKGFGESDEEGSNLILTLLSMMEKAMAPHSSTLAWKIPWTVEPGGLQSMGSRRVGHD